ncbi:MAG: glycosyltransferase, partial [Asticcacaulis sp.]
MTDTATQTATPAASQQRLSCCIITKNEALRIGDCIRAVAGIADDVVVVDSGSTDDT